MFAALSFLRRARQRLLRHRLLNAVAFFVPLAVSGWALSRLTLAMLAAPLLLALVAPVICLGWFSVTCWKVWTAATAQAVASLVDTHMNGKERFLTLASTSGSGSDETFYSLVQRQAEQLAQSFSPKRDLALTLDKRIPWATACAVGSVLLLLFWPSLTSSLISSLPDARHQELANQAPSQEQAIATLEEAARRLLAPTATPQEQLAGAQLSTLLQQLKDPSRTPEEKQKSIDEARKKFSLNSPLPQLFPLDLKIFSGKGNDEKSQGDSGKSPQDGETQPENTNGQSGQSPQAPSSSTAGNETQPGTQKNGEKQPQPQPRQDGGGIKFDFPQPEEKKQGQAPQQPSSTTQQPAQQQTPERPTPGTDPNRLGGQQNNQMPDKQAQGTDPNKRDPNKPDPRREQKNEKGEGGRSVGMGKGERFLKPGEQPGSGFLTKDARFVKVRVPLGRDEQSAEEEGHTTNTHRAAPTTPYSNAPLKEGPLDPAQQKQPIPLEYRSILRE